MFDTSANAAPAVRKADLFPAILDCEADPDCSPCRALMAAKHLAPYAVVIVMASGISALMFA